MTEALLDHIIFDIVMRTKHQLNNILLLMTTRDIYIIDT